MFILAESFLTAKVKRGKIGYSFLILYGKRVCQGRERNILLP